MKLDLKLSKEIMGKCKGLKRQSCYFNSTQSIIKKALYIEGIIVNLKGNYFMEHGWIEKDKKIIDVTAVKFWGKELNVSDYKYYPCLKFSMTGMMNYILKTRGKTPFFKYFPDLADIMRKKIIQIQKTYPEFNDILININMYNESR